MVRHAKSEDISQILDIYNHYVLNTTVTFEESAISKDEMEKRVSEVQQSLPWLLYEQEAKIIGFAYAASWKWRSAYRHAVESTLYVHHQHFRKGIGSQLYGELIKELKKCPVHAVLGGIALPNPESQALHQKLGYHKVGSLVEVGFKFDRWLDVEYWELLL